MDTQLFPCWLLLRKANISRVLYQAYKEEKAPVNFLHFTLKVNKNARSKTNYRLVSLHLPTWSLYKPRNQGLLFGSYKGHWTGAAPANSIPVSISWVSISFFAIQFCHSTVMFNIFFANLIFAQRQALLVGGIQLVLDYSFFYLRMKSRHSWLHILWL